MPIHIENFTYSYFHAEGEIKTGDATVNALIQSIYPALIKHSQKYTRKDLITSGNFPYFSLNIYIQFILSRLESAGAPGI